MPHGKTEKEFASGSELQTLEWAETFAESLKPYDIIGLEGNLGAGKTVICRGIARGLRYKGHVTSPSYVLVNEYSGNMKIYHIDLYRLPENADWEEIGLDHYLNDPAVCMIEWPDRIRHMKLPFSYMIYISHIGENRRGITLTRCALSAME